MTREGVVKKPIVAPGELHLTSMNEFWPQWIKQFDGKFYVVLRDYATGPYDSRAEAAKDQARIQDEIMEWAE